MGDSGGRFVWYELATTDIETAKAFYVDVVGWGIGDTSMPGSVYSLFTAGDVPVAGLMELPPDARRTNAAPQWVGYVSVDDVDVAVGRAKQLGGAVRVPPTDVTNVSRFSVITDPQMAMLALIKGRERGRAQRPAQPGATGHVSWHELLATDLETTFAFYSELFGWRKADADVGPMGTYQQFSAGTETIGGMFVGPKMSLLSVWLYYFNVSDIDAAVKRAEAGGGQILYGPVAVPGGARVVHCKDPQGALFALIDRHIHITIGCYSPRNSSDRPGRRPG